MLDINKELVVQFTEREFADNEEMFNEFLILAKSVVGRENGAKRSESKKLKSQINGGKGGAPLKYLDYTLLTDSGETVSIKVEKTNRDVSLLMQIDKIQNEKQCSVLDWFEC